MKSLLAQTDFSHSLLWSFVYVSLTLVALYLVTIVWLTITHIWSIGRFLTQYIFVTAKLWIQRLFLGKEETPFSSELIELNDLEIPLESTTGSKTAQQTSTKPKSDPIKKQKRLPKERG